MKVQFTSDDPRLTAYVLGELDGQDKAALEQALANQEHLRETVQEIERVIGLIQKSRAAERAVRARRTRFFSRPNGWRRPPSALQWTHWAPLFAVTAAALIFLVWRPILLENRDNARRASHDARPGAAHEYASNIGAAVDAEPSRPPEQANPFLSPRTMPFSVIPLNVGVASYQIIREDIQQKRRPEPASIRIEELVNYFPYQYPEPEEGRPFSLIAETGPAPWSPENRLLRVAVKTPTAELKGIDQERFNQAIARKVQIRVGFSPIGVLAYRLLGFVDDSRTSEPETKDLTAGQSITALFEWTPNRQEPSAGPNGEHMPLTESAGTLDASINVTAQYALPGDDQIRVLERPVHDSGLKQAFIRSSLDFKFAAAVAAYGLILKEDPSIGDFSLEACRDLARQGLPFDPDGKRREFIEFIDLTRSLFEDKKSRR